MRGSSRRLTLLVLFAAFGLAGTASAVEWLLIGARQRGMGGAGVATADESSAVYWNPASLPAESNWSFGLDGSFSVELAPETLGRLEQLVYTIEDLQTTFTDLQASFDALSNPLDPATDDDLADVLNLVRNHFADLDRTDLGLRLDGGFNVNVQAGTFGVSVGAVTYFDAGLIADLGGLAMAALGDATSNMDSAMYLAGTVDLTDPSLAVTYPAEIAGLASTIESMMTVAGVANPNQTTAVLLYIAGMGDATNYLYSDLEALLTPLGVDSFADADLTDPQVQSMLVNIVGATLGSGTLIEDNDTGIHLRGAGVAEVAIAKSFPIIKGKLSVGAAVRMMTARTFNIDVTYAEYSTATGVNDALDDLLAEVQSQFVDDPLDSTGFGLDLGVDFQLNKFVRLGLTMKNLNRPQFDLPQTTDKFVIEPQVRMGVAVKPLPWLLVASDIDLTENRSQVATDYGMRSYSLGAEFSVLKVLQLRAGIYGNLLSLEKPPAFTLGLGVRMGPAFKLDVAANLNADLGKLTGIVGGGAMDVSALPEAAGFSLSMQFHTRF